MNKKTAIVIIGGTVMAVLIILALSKNQKTDSSVVSKSVITTEKTLPSAQTKEYIDPAGFKFSYPTDLTIEKKDTNKDSYSSLALTSEQYSGTLSLDAVATEAAVLDDLTKNNKELQTKTVKKMNVADMNALQYESGNKIITLALDNGVLFTVITDYQEQKKYWTQAYEKIIQSFMFVQPENMAETTSSSYTAPEDDSVSYDGEEIIE